jgi:hypothetical protein
MHYKLINKIYFLYFRFKKSNKKLIELKIEKTNKWNI